MIRLLSAACGLALIGAPALAQTSRASAPEADGTIVLAQRGPDGGYGQWRGRRDWRDSDRDHDDDNADADDRGPGPGPGAGPGRGPDRDRRGGPDGMMAHRPPPPPPNDHGLHIRMRRGDTAIDLRCPSAPDYASCISAVGQLIDKLGGATSAGTSTSGTGTAPSPATPAPGAPSTR